MHKDKYEDSTACESVCEKSLIIEHHTSPCDTTENLFCQIIKTLGDNLHNLKKLSIIGSINEAEIRAIAMNSKLYEQGKFYTLDELDLSKCKIVGNIYLSPSNDEVTAHEAQFQSGDAIPYCLYSMSHISPKRFYFPKGVTTIGSRAFYMSNLEGDLKIPEGVVSILSEAFGRNNSLTSLELPSSLRYIGVQAFQFCRYINNKILFPSELSAIGYRAFRGCDGIIKSGTEFPFDICPMWDEELSINKE